MAWRVANSLTVLLGQVNVLSPNRNKSSDGSIGDERHQAESSSDHNPWVKDGSMGVVTARDFTNDPAHGMPSQALADALVASKDERIKYIISNKRIISGTGQSHPAWQWRPYTGSNPHDHHVHVSVKSDKKHYDDESPWKFTLKIKDVPMPTAKPIPTVLKLGLKGDEVRQLQTWLKLPVDGDFGPSTQTAVKTFQATHGLTIDGIVGPQTWNAISKDHI